MNAPPHVEPVAAFLGISIGRPYYSDLRLGGYCAWANIKYSHFAFLVGDFLYSYSLQAFKGVSTEVAMSRSMVIGDNVSRQLSKFLASMKPETRIIRWSEIAQYPLYKDIFSKCTALYDENASFSQAVRDQIFINLGSRVSICGASRDHRCRRGNNSLLDYYIMHEVAGLIFMAENYGYPLEIYPGPDLRIISRLYNNEWPALMPFLASPPKRKFLELEIDDVGDVALLQEVQRG